MAAPVIISGSELRLELMGAGIANGAIHLLDDAYVCPRSDWLLGEYDRWFGSFLDTFDLNYSAEDWDCDDFADLYSVHARLAHKRTPGHLAGHSSPVGIMHFLRPAGAAHATVLARTADRGLMAIEPQIRRNVVELTPAAYRSCWLTKI